LALHDFSRSLDIRHFGSIAQGPTGLTFSDTVAGGVAVSISRLLAISFAVAKSYAAGANVARAYR
jgi:hypothetical protein